jgi:hypothetical protein
VNDRLIMLGAKATCACLRFDVLDHYLRESDALISKAVSVSEVAQIARIEVRVRKALLVKWNARAVEASASAGAVYKSGGTLAAAFAACDKAMNKWDDDVRANYAQSLEDVYKLARRAAHNKVTGKSKASLQYSVPSIVVAKAAPKSGGAKGSVQFAFDVVDERAIDKLSKQELWWIGGTYKNVAPTIRTAVEPKVIAGLSRKLGGEMVAKAVKERLDDFRIPDGFKGSSERYFEGLAANAVTAARVGGQLGSFMKLGVTTYELVNPMDSRTSAICAELNGMTFQVADAGAQLEKLGKAQTPEQFKAIKPWLSVDRIASLAARGPGALSKAGQMFPPFHFRCRTTVDVSTESLSFSALED